MTDHIGDSHKMVSRWRLIAGSFFVHWGLKIMGVDPYKAMSVGYENMTVGEAVDHIQKHH